MSKKITFITSLNLFDRDLFPNRCSSEPFIPTARSRLGTIHFEVSSF